MIGPGLSAALRLVALVVWAVLLVQVLRRGRVARPASATFAVVGGFLTSALLAFAGVVQFLGIATPPGFLSDLYTVAAVTGAGVGLFVARRGRL